jgi:hypothetical protein
MSRTRLRSSRLCQCLSLCVCLALLICSLVLSPLASGKTRRVKGVSQGQSGNGANILDIRLNPNVGQERYGRMYGNPNSTIDTDTGEASEECTFGPRK